jgi:hypothetical protein
VCHRRQVHHGQRSARVEGKGAKTMNSWPLICGKGP